MPFNNKLTEPHAATRSVLGQSTINFLHCLHVSGYLQKQL
jgi:hypothetical protein